MVLSGWTSYVIVEEVYTIKAINEYVCVNLGCLYGFNGDEYSV